MYGNVHSYHTHTHTHTHTHARKGTLTHTHTHPPASALDNGFEPRSGQTNDYKFGICCFSEKHTALRRKGKDWLARNQNNVSEWGDMSTRGLLFQ